MMMETTHSEPAPTPACIHQCAEHNVKLLNVEDMQRAMKETKQQQDIDLRTRLASHCAERNKTTCRIVEGMQKRIVQENEESSWTFPNIEPQYAICVQMVLYDLAIHSTYTRCRDTIRVKLDGCKTCKVNTYFRAKDHHFWTEIYNSDRSSVSIAYIRTYFEYLDSPPSKWSLHALWYGLCE